MANEHPLFNGTGQNTLFRTTLNLPPLPPGGCLTDANSIREWFAKATVDVQSNDTALFGYAAGTKDAASPRDKDKPYFLFNAQGVYLGLSAFLPEIQDFSLPGVPGEFKTVKRSESTVEEDMREKCLGGWFLADGTNGTDDLTGEAACFAGDAPDYTRYTVMKVQ